MSPADRVRLHACAAVVALFASSVALAQDLDTQPFVDPLSTSKGGLWPEASSVGFEHGAYHIRAAGVAYQYQFCDGLVQIEAEHFAGATDAGFGLCLRIRCESGQKEHSGYEVLITADGKWALVRLDANVPTELIPWRFSSLLNTGEGAVNTVGAVCKGETITVLLNGSTAGRAKDSAYASPGGIGVVSTSKAVEAAFRTLETQPLLPAALVSPPSMNVVKQKCDAEFKRLTTTDGMRLDRVRQIAQTEALAKEYEGMQSELDRMVAELDRYPDRIRDEQDGEQSDLQQKESAQTQVDEYERQAQQYEAQGNAISAGILRAGSVLTSQQSVRDYGRSAQNHRSNADDLSREAQQKANAVNQYKGDMSRKQSEAQRSQRGVESLEQKIEGLDGRNPFAEQPVSGTLVVSHLGNPGPCFGPGLTPSALGWGGDDTPYPDRIAVNWADGAEMVWVPAGTFIMGTRDEDIPRIIADLQRVDPSVQNAATAGETAHKVEITSGFWMYRHEITCGQMRRFLPDYPGEYLGAAEGMKWSQAKDYGTQVGASLPTEAEWEYACRAGEMGPFWWGNRPDDEAGRAELAGDDSLEIGKASPNPLGLYDMLGNAAEWCGDWLDRSYYGSSPAQDPPGPKTGTQRVVRGGWQGAGMRLQRCACRIGGPEGDEGGKLVGFRLCVRP